MNGLAVSRSKRGSKRRSKVTAPPSTVDGKFGFEGHPLSAKDFESGRVLFTHYQPRLQYAWDTGTAIGRYLRELKRGRLMGEYCKQCRRTLIPPRGFCERCYRPMDEWVELKDRGILNTFSVSYVRWDAVRIEEPIIPAVIEMEGASPGVGIMHRLGGVEDPKTIQIGMKVRAVWRPESEREGAITDIQYFTPE